MEVLSPVLLWRDKNLEHPPFDPITVRVDVTNGVEATQMYFCSQIEDGLPTRVFCRLSKRQDVEKPPVLVVIDDLGQDFFAHDITQYLDAGFAVFQFDYSGERPTGKYTFFPASLSHCNFLTNTQTATAVTAHPEDSCWYEWSLLSLRAIAFARTLDAVDGDRLSVLGVGAGGAHAVKACLKFDSMERVVLRFDIGLPFDSSTNESINMQASLDSASYVRSLSTPALIEVASNESNGSFDRMTALYEKLTSEDKRLAISESENHSIGRAQSQNALLWLLGTPAPQPPTLKATSSDGKLYYEIVVDNALEPIQSIDLFFSVGTADPAYRYWERRRVERAGEDSYICRVEVDDIDEQCIAFAKLCYKSGYCLSTLPVKVIPRSLGITAQPSARSRVLFGSEMGIDCWTVLKKHEAKGDDITLATGPFDIEGVSGLSCELSTLKIGDIRYRAGGSMLQISVCGSTQQDIVVKIIDSNGRVFESEESISTSWSKLTLSPRDFHGKGSFDWEQVQCLTITSQTPIIVSNILWI